MFDAYKKILAMKCTDYRMAGTAFLCLLALLLPGCNSYSTTQPQVRPRQFGQAYEEQLASVRLLQGRDAVSLSSKGTLRIKDIKASHSLGPGDWTFELVNSRPAQSVYHLFVKAFNADKSEEATAYAHDNRHSNLKPITLGKVLSKARSGSPKNLIDNRIFWFSSGTFQTKEKADQAQKEMEASRRWCWVREQITEPGGGQLLVKNSEGNIVLTINSQARLSSSQPITVRNIDYGFWSETSEDRAYAGDLVFSVGTDARINLDERIDVEEYIAGILPAEMLPGWPAEALKAQAVAARSGVMAKLEVAHKLDGYDFCATEHCRAYAGISRRTPATDQAVADTKGDVMVFQGRTVDAVFSATCGGWTENNEDIWAGPANPVLRGRPDFHEQRSPLSPADNDTAMAEWLAQPPDAFCAHDERYFRWSREFSADELSQLVNERHKVGRVKAIELGGRSVSGRLKWVKIHGEDKSETITKELNIRFAFGGLPSAMFIIQAEQEPEGPELFTFTGGGRGHGVGMCQYGACGLARRGVQYRQILEHYYSGIQIERLR